MYVGAKGGGQPLQLWDFFIGQKRGMGVGKKNCDEGAPRPSKGAQHSCNNHNRHPQP